MSVEDILGELAFFASQPLDEELAAEFGIVQADTSPGHQQRQTTYTWTQIVGTTRASAIKQQQLRAVYEDDSPVPEVDLAIWIMDSDPLQPELHAFGQTKQGKVTHYIYREGRWQPPSPDADEPGAYQRRIAQAVNWLWPPEKRSGNPRPVLRPI